MFFVFNLISIFYLFYLSLLLDVSERDEDVAGKHLPNTIQKSVQGWSLYSDANLVPTSLLTDGRYLNEGYIITSTLPGMLYFSGAFTQSFYIYLTHTTHIYIYIYLRYLYLPEISADLGTKDPVFIFQSYLIYLHLPEICADPCTKDSVYYRLT